MKFDLPVPVSYAVFLAVLTFSLASRAAQPLMKAALQAPGQEWCHTDLRMRVMRLSDGAEDPVCPIQGQPDLLEVRDAAIPSAVTPFKTVRLNIVILAKQTKPHLQRQGGHDR